KATRGQDGFYSFAMPLLPITAYLRFAHQYAYIAAPDKSSITGDKLPPPEKVFTDKSGTTLAGRFQINQVPDLIKQIVLGQLELRLATAAEEKREGETEAQAALRQQAVKAVARQLAALINEGNEVAVHLDVNRKTDTVAGEIRVTAQPKSGLQATLGELGQEPSRAAAVLSGQPALSGSAHVPVSPELRQALGSALNPRARDAPPTAADPHRQ